MDQAAKLPTSEHTRLPWRIHAIAADFRIEDVWSLPTPGGADDFPRLLQMMESFDPADSSPVIGALFAIRWHVGRWLGMDRGDAGLGVRVGSLRDRLPADLRAADASVGIRLPFRAVYVTDREAAFEIANETMHGVLHLGWVPDGVGGYSGQMAVLVKPNGWFGRVYMAAITPFRYGLVYPMMLQAIGTRWTTSVRKLDHVPRDARDLSLLSAVDYADAFLVDTRFHPERSAHDWALAVLEEAPLATRTQLLAGWTALGLKGAESGESVLGWTVRRRGEDFVLLGRDSRIGMPGELLFALRPDGLLFATFVDQRSPGSKAMWAAVRATHVRTVTALLQRSARYPAGGGGAAGSPGAAAASPGAPGELGRFGPGGSVG
jgi:Protein of unknown function (DUF2867)